MQVNPKTLSADIFAETLTVQKGYILNAKGINCKKLKIYLVQQEYSLELK